MNSKIAVSNFELIKSEIEYFFLCFIGIRLIDSLRTFQAWEENDYERLFDAQNISKIGWKMTKLVIYRIRYYISARGFFPIHQ